MKVKSKIVLVTGGGNGIGRALVLGLLARGASVAAVDISEKALGETASLAGDTAMRLSTHVADITSRDAVSALVRDVTSRHGGVDAVINNAGIIHTFAAIADLEAEEINRVINVNLHGVINMTKAFLPVLRERPEAHIVNVSSMGGFFPFPGQTLYGATKAAVKIFSEGLAAELADTNVRVTVVFPGAIGTDIAKNSGITLSEKMERMQKMQEEKFSFLLTTPKKAADTIIKGMENNRLRVFVGPDSKSMDLFYRISPNWSTRLIHKLTGGLLLNKD